MADLFADLSHKDIPDALLHEVKGASTAAAGTVLTATGTGSTTFQSSVSSSLSREDYLSSASYSDQSTSVQKERKARFTAESSPNNSVSIAADGTITFNQEGVYTVDASFNVTASVSACMRFLLNGIQVEPSVLRKYGSNSTLYFRSTLEVTAGSVLEYFVSAETDSSQAPSFISTNLPRPTDWPRPPSTSVRIAKLGI